MGIIVKWIRPTDPGTEYIDDIDLDNLEDCPDQMQTKFWSPDEDEFIVFEIEVRVEQLVDDLIHVIVTYDPDNNPGFPYSDDFWGTNTIITEQGQDHGDYHWSSNNGYEFHSEGHNCGWKKIELHEPRDHRRSHQQIRDEHFRPQIIALDRQCVITGETTKAALDAAHIIPAAKSGNEIPENGILLRADIHRLYDAGMFIIHPETESR